MAFPSLNYYYASRIPLKMEIILFKYYVQVKWHTLLYKKDIRYNSTIKEKEENV